MMKKRERLEIIHDILKIIMGNSNSIKPTPLLRQSNLSSQLFDRYIDELIEKKLIKEAYDKKERKFFTLTDLGYQYLERYKAILGFIDDFNL